jgi:hypothetical protein
LVESDLHRRKGARIFAPLKHDAGRHREISVQAPVAAEDRAKFHPMRVGWSDRALGEVDDSSI